MASKLICYTQLRQDFKKIRNLRINLTLWRVLETILPLEKQQCVVCILDLNVTVDSIKCRVLHNNAFTANSCRRQQ